MSRQNSRTNTSGPTTRTEMQNLGVVKEKGLAKGKAKVEVQVRVEAGGKVEVREKGQRSTFPQYKKASDSILARRLSPHFVSSDRIGYAATSRQSGDSTG